MTRTEWSRVLAFSGHLCFSTQTACNLNRRGNCAGDRSRGVFFVPVYEEKMPGKAL